MIVVDASVIGPLMLPDEQAALPPEAVERLLDSPFKVPMHWHLEVGNMVEMAFRRQRISLAELRAILHGVERLAVDLDDRTAEKAWTETMDLARAHGLSLYDAAYIELARRCAIPLATFDAALITTAETVGVALVDLDR